MHIRDYLLTIAWNQRLELWDGFRVVEFIKVLRELNRAAL